MLCPNCGIGFLRTSRIRLADLPRLLILRWPVRCSVCADRSYVGLGTAMKFPRSTGS
jgi:hypothetical protein